MLEIFKGLNFLDPKFFVPLLIGIVVIIIVINVAKKLVKFAVLLAVAGLVLLIYLNMPDIKIEGTNAIVNVKGHEYVINPRDVKIESPEVDGKKKVFLVSGETRIELPFSKDFAERFFIEKLKEGLKESLEKN